MSWSGKDHDEHVREPAEHLTVAFMSTEPAGAVRALLEPDSETEREPTPAA